MGGHPDSEIRTGPSLINFFLALWASVCVENKRSGDPGLLPWINH